jgi:opacity protein-like surface antigen
MALLLHQLDRGGQTVKTIRLAIVAGIALLFTAPAARAEGFITPFVGYNFGGDSGNCPSLRNCSDKHTNFGVSFGSMGPVFGIEEDISYAKNFFGDAPGTNNSVFSAMTNLLVGIGVGPVRPYVVGGLGIIRPHVSSLSLSADNNTLGYDLGGGVTVSVAPHVGIRGDIRHFHTLQDVNVLIFTGQRLDFLRASAGLALKF